MTIKSSTVRSQEPAEYNTRKAESEQAIIDQAMEILRSRIIRGESLTSPDCVRKYLRTYLTLKSAHLEREEFGMVLMNTQHETIAINTLFVGTLDSASVYPREVVKEALSHNAGAVILFHNHPSGLPEPSSADRVITKQIQEALDLVGTRVLDHIIVGGDQSVSFAERGLL